MGRHFHSFIERRYLGQRLSRHSTTFHNALFLTPYAMPTAPGVVILYEKVHAVWMWLYITEHAVAMSMQLATPNGESFHTSCERAVKHEMSGAAPQLGSWAAGSAG